MRSKLSSSLAGATLIGLLASSALAQAPAATPRTVHFESASLPAKQKELLTKYAEAVGRWALVQRIVQAVEAQNEVDLSPERIADIDRRWQAGEDPDDLPSQLASNSCAQVLQALLASNPGYAEAFVTDRRGALVCMTSRTTDYFQGDEEKWQRAWADGAGSSFVGAMAHDDSVDLDVVPISVPVMSRGEAIGVLVAGRIMAAGG
jgi:hypothetical protein